MHAAKAAIAHTQHMVAGSGCRLDLGNQLLDVVGYMRAVNHGGEGTSGVPVQAACVAKGNVGGLQAPWELGDHGAQLHGVAARLKHRENALTGPDLAAQPVYGRADHP